MSLGLLCHLVELFYRHASLPLQEVLPASFFFPALIAGHAHKSLVLAMGAYSMRFSAHTAAQSVSATGLRADEYLANATQASLNMNGGGTIKEHIFQVQAGCVLLEYEASQSRGRSAWVHIGKLIPWLSPSPDRHETKLTFLSNGSYREGSDLDISRRHHSQSRRNILSTIIRVISDNDSIHPLPGPAVPATRIADIRFLCRQASSGSRRLSKPCCAT